MLLVNRDLDHYGKNRATLFYTYYINSSDIGLLESKHNRVAGALGQFNDCSTRQFSKQRGSSRKTISRRSNQGDFLKSTKRSSEPGV